MKKKLFIVAIPFLALVSSCSYGGIAKVSHGDFNRFYNRGDLVKQKDYNFALGVDLSYTGQTPYEEDESYVKYETFDLTSSSLPKWESDYIGNNLSFKLFLSIGDDEETLETRSETGDLSFTSKNVTETDDDGNVKLVGKLDTYTYRNTSDNSKSDTYKYQNLLQMTYTKYFEYIEEEEKFDEDPTYTEYRYEKSSSIFADMELEDGKRIVGSSSESEIYSYKYYSDSRNNWSYTNYESTVATYSEKEGGTYVPVSKVSATKQSETMKNIGASSVDKGKKEEKYTFYDYVEGEFVVNPDKSYETKDEDYRRYVEPEDLAQFIPNNLLLIFKNSDNLALFFGEVNLVIHKIFTDFEKRNEEVGTTNEIIRFGDTYQYRTKLNNTTIVQYTFVEGAENKDRLTNIVYFEIGSGGLLTETFKVTLLY